MRSISQSNTVVEFCISVCQVQLRACLLQYVFRPPAVAKGSNQRTVHEELAKQLTNILRPAQTDPQLVNSFLSHAAFFFDVLLKSMTLFLIDTERIKVATGLCQHCALFLCRMCSLACSVSVSLPERHGENQGSHQSLSALCGVFAVFLCMICSLAWSVSVSVSVS